MLITSSSVPSAVSEYLNRRMLRRAFPNLVLGQVFSKADLPANSGTIMDFMRVTPLPVATMPLTEGTAPSPDSLSEVKIQAPIEEFGAYTVHTNFHDATNDHGKQLLKERNDIAARQAAETLETLLANEASSGTNVLYGGGVASRAALVTTTERISTDILLKSLRTLQKANATPISKVVTASTGIGTSPIREAFFAFTTPDVIYDIETQQEAGADFGTYTATEKYGSQQAVNMHEAGAYKGVRFFTSTLAKTYLGGGGTAVGAVQSTGGIADVHTVLIFGEEAVACVRLSGKSLQMIVHPTGSSGVADPINQRGTIGWYMVNGRTITNQTWMMRLEVTVGS